MHGVKRSRQTADSLAKRKERELKEINHYLALSEEVLKRKSNNDWTREAFSQTTAILTLNPEFYTIWNYRRNILLKGIFLDSEPNAVNDILTEELNMIMLQLRTHPKVYWIWNHRRWCLESVPDGPGSEGPSRFGWRQVNWDHELMVAETMLERDARNYHAWNYRRYILASHPIPRSAESELAYTKKKIENNFSNFSAWHQRSRVFSTTVDPLLDLESQKDAEFEFVKSALWTDPADQSAWIYHRWLVGTKPSTALLQREIGLIEELLEEEPNSKWCLESLVEYRLQLLEDPSFSSDGSSLSNLCLENLQTLQKLDPLREQRYASMAERLVAIRL